MEEKTTSPDALTPALITARVVELGAARVPSFNSQRAYASHLRHFMTWFRGEGYSELSKSALQAYRDHLTANNAKPATIGARMSAIRSLIREAEDAGTISRTHADSLRGVKTTPRSGEYRGNWLTEEQANQLLAKPDDGTLIGIRDRALIATLLGTGLRREEVSKLERYHYADFGTRKVFLNIEGKRRRVRTVGVPAWAARRIDAWLDAANITEGRIFRAILKGNQRITKSLSAGAIWKILVGYGHELGTPVRPHDCRRTHAQMARGAGAQVEQIQLTLGHSSIATTERYLGSRQNLEKAPGDYFSLGD